ncbi:hypothetical protein KO488_04560 [Poseidonibacter lekithochrous]|uniref:hypothetical protein n=1 Tax=Poseidonibacter TaxID=2321187 RepID=UPI001C08ADB0|nr:MULTISPECIES: hypothetical protein [Poseidonibacter]MBU3014019.1 hypothetical protein [Poseidonibacter lekithochrous]MDO6827314.1 hypothetical protein [Poseidonibacter sp. 1_MG-2023]
MKLNNKYLNLKKILEIYNDRYARREELEYELDLSKDQVGRIITLLKNMEIFEKGNNKISENLYNKSIFNTKEFNIALLASLAYVEEDKSKEIIKYFFKDTTKNLTFAITNNYSRNFQENLIKLIDERKYKFFASIIKDNNNALKTCCKVSFIESERSENIIPLEFFIFEDSWFICAYFVKNKKIDIIDTKNIEDVTLVKYDFSDYINISDIEKCIKRYISEKNIMTEELVLLRLNPITLSLLVEFDLVSSYEIFEDRNNDKLFLLNINRFNDELSKINIDNLISNIDTPEDLVENKRIVFYEEDTKNYIIKTKLSKSKLKFILNSFNNIQQIK